MADPALIEGISVDAEIDAFVARAASRDLHRAPALSAFQRQMEQYPQLSATAQRQLVDRVREGERAAAKLEEGKVSDKAATKLRQTVKDGRRAADYLVGANFRLVLLICSEKARERFGIERAGEMMPDLVAEANVALSEAIGNYDPRLCPVFATYVARVVRDRVQFVMSKDGPIRLAPSWNRLKRIAAVRIPTLTTELGRKPTEEELREDLFQHCRQWAYDKLTPEQRLLPEAEREEVMLAKLRKQGMLGALASLADVLIAAQSVASLDTPVGEDGSSTLGEMISSGGRDELLDGAELDELRSTLGAVFAELSDRERTIVAMRFGLVPGERYGETATYAEIGEVFSITAERIRQIERSVLDRIASASPHRDRLAAFLPGLGQD